MLESLRLLSQGLFNFELKLSGQWGQAHTLPQAFSLITSRLQEKNIRTASDLDQEVYMWFCHPTIRNRLGDE